MDFIIGVLTVISVGYGICELVQFIKYKLLRKKDGEKEC